MNFLNEFPGYDGLKTWYEKHKSGKIYDVNGHIHTPYSFSAFQDLEQAFRMAVEEQIRILGINDFNTTEGYEGFHELGKKYGIFPLFNIEFMGLLKDEQKNGIRINDPNNPGRIYFSGKGLDYPVTFSNSSNEKIDSIKEESHRQMIEMTGMLNAHLHDIDPGLQANFHDIKAKFTKGMVRERHIARALHKMIFDKYQSHEERISILTKLFNNRKPETDIDNEAALENEIRGNLLKAGGVAYVKEDQDSFLELEEIISIINDGGGIPCYPVLLDNPKGEMTEYEADMEKLHNNLQERNISCLELIPGRNDIHVLKKLVSFFNDKGFIITFGTEHNSPKLDPLKVSARENCPLDNELSTTGYEGACVIAAHQYLRAKGEDGFTTNRGMEQKNEFIDLGKAVIEKYLIS